MNIKNHVFALLSICLIGGVSIAQESPSEGVETTSSKSYKIDMGNKMVSRTVEISTEKSNTINLDEEDKGKVNQDRAANNLAMITKTVRIDNDDDDAFDEKIVFTYNSVVPEDFVLVSNNKELMVAIEEGENLKIIEDINLKSKEKTENSSTYIFTDSQGKEIEFLVEEHQEIKNEKIESK
ncbi:hypothetical protein ACEZ3G_10065 [Maribacter algicola]|uniref:Uncharacterized protein n=1 Tax=Meishania litoralis TaxID=3434685 RepID=A0ACC7LKQ3_9FLAO